MENMAVLGTGAEALETGEIDAVFDAVHLAEALHRGGCPRHHGQETPQDSIPHFQALRGRLLNPAPFPRALDPPSQPHERAMWLQPRMRPLRVSPPCHHRRLSSRGPTPACTPGPEHPRPLQVPEGAGQANRVGLGAMAEAVDGLTPLFDQIPLGQGA